MAIRIYDLSIADKQRMDRLIMLLEKSLGIQPEEKPAPFYLVASGGVSEEALMKKFVERPSVTVPVDQYIGHEQVREGGKITYYLRKGDVITEVDEEEYLSVFENMGSKK